jgi:hypothetical protein
MTFDAAAATLMVGVLLGAALPGCADEDQRSQQPLRLCVVYWSGTLATGSSTFDVQACYNGRCTSNISVQVAPLDAGVAVEHADAGCVPTTPGGPPSRCDSVPLTPGPGCGTGQIGDEFSVQACSQASGDGTAFSVLLTPANDSLPDGGDQLGLTIQTADGDELVRASARIPRDDVTSSGCQGAGLDLEGTPIVQ